MRAARSRNAVPIRLTEERWLHVTEEHAEMAGYYYEVLETIQEPQAVLEGKAGELLAVRESEPGKHMVVVYREMSEADGFVITAFFTRGVASIRRRPKRWPP